MNNLPKIPIVHLSGGRHDPAYSVDVKLATHPRTGCWNIRRLFKHGFPGKSDSVFCWKTFGKQCELCNLIEIYASQYIRFDLWTVKMKELGVFYGFLASDQHGGQRGITFPAGTLAVWMMTEYDLREIEEQLKPALVAGLLFSTVGAPLRININPGANLKNKEKRCKVEVLPKLTTAYQIDVNTPLLEDLIYPLSGPSPDQLKHFDAAVEAFRFHAGLIPNMWDLKFPPRSGLGL